MPQKITENESRRNISPPGFAADDILACFEKQAGLPQPPSQMEFEELYKWMQYRCGFVSRKQMRRVLALLVAAGTLKRREIRRVGVQHLPGGGQRKVAEKEPRVLYYLPGEDDA